MTIKHHIGDDLVLGIVDRPALAGRVDDPLNAAHVFPLCFRLTRHRSATRFQQKPRSDP